MDVVFKTPLAPHSSRCQFKQPEISKTNDSLWDIKQLTHQTRAKLKDYTYVFWLVNSPKRKEHSDWLIS